MGAYTKVHADWKDYPDTTTPVTQAALEQIEQGIADAHTEHIEKTLADAKGDLIVASAADTFGREPVGANDTALVADSAQTRGVKWTKIGNAQVADAAAIAYAKLNLASSIVNADIATAADIARSKVRFVGVKAARTANQTIAHNTATAIQFNAADEFDSDTFHDTVTNNTRLTVPSGLDGKYILIGNIRWATNSTAQRLVQIRKNGTTVLAEDVRGSPGNPAHSVSVHADLVAGDYVELIAFQDTGGNLDAVSVMSLSMVLV